MLRTSDGNLHVVWSRHLASGKYSYQWSTMSSSGAAQASGTILSGWVTLENDPRLLADGSGIRLVFIGGQDTNRANFYSIGAVYTETSADGSSWTLVHGSMAQHTVLNRGLAAALAADGTTPVAVFGLNNILYLHQGVDAHAPSAKADATAATGPTATGLAGAALATDHGGALWLAWYDQGYWVRQLLPSAGAPMKVPGSGSGTPDNSPSGQVAFAARAGGGVYLAYCSPSASTPCAQISLWQVGSATQVTVPGSDTGTAGRVGIAAGPGGRLWLTWFDSGTNMIHAVETDASATSFGAAQAIALPPGTAILEGLQAEGSGGPLDIIANVLVNAAGNPTEFWQVQIPAS